MIVASLLPLALTVPDLVAPAPFLIAAFVALLAGIALRELLAPATRLRRRVRLGVTVLLLPLLLIVGAGLGARLLTIAVPIFETEIALASAPQPSAPTAAASAPTSAGPVPTGTASPAAVATATSPATSPTGTAASAAATSTRPGQATPGTPENVARTIAELRSGALVGQIRYSNGTTATVQLRFDNLTGAAEPPASANVTTYQGTTGSRTDERVVIGNRSWTRTGGQGWTAATAQDPLQDVRSFLPPLDSFAVATRADNGDYRWYDRTRDADYQLLIDLATGLPSGLLQTSRSTGTTVTVQYQRWNTPETIVAPSTGAPR